MPHVPLVKSLSANKVIEQSEVTKGCHGFQGGYNYPGQQWYDPSHEDHQSEKELISPMVRPSNLQGQMFIENEFDDTIRAYGRRFVQEDHRVLL